MDEQRNNRKIGVIIGLIVLLAIFIPLGLKLYSLVQQNKRIYIHNPLEKTMVIAIGDASYKLSSNESIAIDLSEGSHRMQSFIKGKTLMDTTVTVSAAFIDKGGVINLSREPMYLWSEIYGGMMLSNEFLRADSSYVMNNPAIRRWIESAKILTIDSTMLCGDIKEFSGNQVLITKEWDYDINRSFEDKIQSSNYTSSLVGESKSKIFNKYQMLAYWEQTYALFEDNLRELFKYKQD